MAKRIKFPLEMKDGVRVRTIEELRENVDGEKLDVDEKIFLKICMTFFL